MKRDDRFQNPIPRGLTASKPADERARKRILDDREIRDLWAAADMVKTPKCFPLLVKTLLLTMRRRKERAGITWDEIGADGIWTIPAARHKTGKKAGDLFMPLTQRVLDMLGERQPGFVFATNGKVPFAGFDLPTIELRKAMNELRAKEGRAPVANFTLHDLRRTGRSLMSRAKVWPDVAELCMGHALKGVKGVYDRHSYEAELARWDMVPPQRTAAQRLVRPSYALRDTTRRRAGRLWPFSSDDHSARRWLRLPVQPSCPQRWWPQAIAFGASTTSLLR